MQIEHMRICPIELNGRLCGVWIQNVSQEKTENGGKFSKFKTLLFSEKHNIVQISETKYTYSLDIIGGVIL